MPFFSKKANILKLFYSIGEFLQIISKHFFTFAEEIKKQTENSMHFSDLFKVGLIPDTNKINSISEFASLKDTPQSKKYHHEGDAYKHTMLVVDAMREIISTLEHPSHEYKLTLMAAALCHDLGKVTTTYFDGSKQDYACKNHGAEGEKIIRSLFFDEEPKLLNNVCSLVRHHMAFHHIFDGGKDTKNKLITMSLYPMSIKEHLFMNIADKKGTVNETETDDFIKAHFDRIKSEAEELGIFEQPYLFKTTEERRLFFNPKANIDKPKFTMFVMIGLPGSGKNYYIEKFLSTVLEISRDDIRTKIGIKGEKPQGNKEQEEYVTQIFNDEVIKCCKEQKDFVINNTNVKKQYRDGYRNLVKRYNPYIVYILLNTDVDTCKERRKGLMPLTVIDKMAKNFDYPDPSEYDELIIV